MTPTKADGGWLIALVISAMVFVTGYLYNQLVTAAVGGIFLTGITTLVVNRMLQKDIRKYEKANVTVREVYGPIHADLLAVKRSLTEDKTNYLLSDFGLGIQNRPGICSSYRCYLLPKDERDKLRSFFQAVDEYIGLPGNATTRITSIAQVVAQETFEFKDLANMTFRVKENDGQIMDVAQGKRGWWWGLVFWRTTPSQSLKQHGKLIEGVLENRYKRVIQVPAADADKFIERCWKEADKDPVILETRKRFQELENGVDTLLDEVIAKIDEWVKA